MSGNTKITIGVSSALVVLFGLALHAALFGVMFEAAHSLKVDAACQTCKCEHCQCDPCRCVDCDCKPVRKPGLLGLPGRIGSAVSVPVVTGGSANIAAHDEIKQAGGCSSCARVRMPYQVVYPQPVYRPVVPAVPVNPATPVITPAVPQSPMVTPVANPIVTTPAVPSGPVAAVHPRCNLALFVDSSPRSQTLMQWFNTNRELLNLRTNCAYQVYTPESATYVSRFATIVPRSAFPALLFMMPDGGVIHKVRGDANMPSTGEQLVADLKHSFVNVKDVKEAEARNSLHGSGVSWDANPGLAGVNPYSAGSSRCPDGKCPDGNCPDGICPADGGASRPFFHPFRDDVAPHDGIVYDALWGGVATTGLIIGICVVGFLLFFAVVALAIKSLRS